MFTLIRIVKINIYFSLRIYIFGERERVLRKANKLNQQREGPSDSLISIQIKILFDVIIVIK